MSKHGKLYRDARSRVEDREYGLEDAVSLLRGMQRSSFVESVDLSIRLGVDPKYPEQNVRGTVALPHGTGRQVRVLVIASGEKIKEAEDAGADHAGGEEMVEKIQAENWFDFDTVVTTPDMMRHVGRLGKVLGPKGLMPSPKAGTVTFNLKETVEEIKKGRVEFKVDKTGIINSSIGRMSFDDAQIAENVRSFIQAVLKARPGSLKGRYVRSIYLSTTMSPGVKLLPQDYEQ
ncbi:MAG: 50S ribosomal protein L1 [Acidobacteriota bacterium]|jgi:large subunit ribosomal protein L1|nr:50S ribosomal protein L1 [Acidobacteriota bacterium]